MKKPTKARSGGKGSKSGPGSWVLGPGSWVLGPGSWVLGPGSWVLGPGSWVLQAVFAFSCDSSSFCFPLFLGARTSSSSNPLLSI
ncbi:hypothetical protein C9J01_20615 [Photobacterium rosenbergii]|uniref:Uncharacterized protein n=1 Tax=Photobacterium rosenbergii TaxID=294936 RepID=A0A2T3N8Q7_9GAMM|nr:hypothetical protein C9J01_20615 [Photobacterium rosenbergii]